MKTLTHRLIGTSKRRSKLPLLLAFAGLMALCGTNAIAETAELSGELLDRTPRDPRSGEQLQPYYVYDGKTYPGSACKYIDNSDAILLPSTPDTYSNPVKYDDRGVYMQDGTVTHVVCPVVRDKTTNANGTFSAKVYVNNQGPNELWCELYSRGTHGQLMEVDRDATTAGGDQTLSLDVNVSAAWGTYNIYCKFYNGARIYGYQVKEFRSTDSNN